MIVVKTTNTWNKYLDLIPDNKKDVYFYEEYVKLYQDKNSEAVCIVAEEKDFVILLPIIRRKFCNFFDFETPYGYGGLISNNDDYAWILSATTSIYDYLAENNYLAGFVRFHPLLNNVIQKGKLCEVMFDRHTVSINLSAQDDEIFSTQISSKNRNMIRRAISEGLTFYADYDFLLLEQFIDLYSLTMRRLHAVDFYFFDDIYYKTFSENLKGKSFLGCIKKDKLILAAALFLYSKEYGHYHLAGSLPSGYHGVNNLLLWYAALELKKMGVKEFHLGGGTDSDIGNSLFKFKRSFSNSVKDFYIGKMILNQEAYHLICEKWEKDNPEKKTLYQNRLLKYRY